MGQIAITGGKGGTGKSTFSLLLASRLSSQGNRVVLFDADVECPNDHLLLDIQLENREAIHQSYPDISADICTRCGKCVESCRFNALYQIGGLPSLVKDLCAGCGVCWNVCPVGAISVKKEECGESYVNKVSDNLWLVTGRSLVGVEETGGIVRDAKKRAEALARKVRADYLLIDTAAGTHCSVINALLGSEKAYIVTEPTPLGAHDTRIMLKLLDVLKIPRSLVLNKAGVGDNHLIEKLAVENNLTVEYTIPYSEDLIRAYSSSSILEKTSLLTNAEGGKKK